MLFRKQRQLNRTLAVNELENVHSIIILESIFPNYLRIISKTFYANVVLSLYIYEYEINV